MLLHAARWLAVLLFIAPCLFLNGQPAVLVAGELSCVAQGFNLTSLTTDDLLWTGGDKAQMFAIRVCGQVETKGRTCTPHRGGLGLE